MVVLDEYKFKLGELSKTLEQANAQMRPEELKTELKGLEDQMSAADFWNDVDAANKVTQRVKSIKGKLERLDKLNGNREDIQTLIEMAEEEDEGYSRRYFRVRVPGAPAGSIVRARITGADAYDLTAEVL